MAEKSASPTPTIKIDNGSLAALKMRNINTILDEKIQKMRDMCENKPDNGSDCIVHIIYDPICNNE